MSGVCRSCLPSYSWFRPARSALRCLRLDKIEIRADDTPDEFLALNEALEKLETTQKLKADLVKLRFLAGLTNQQAADSLGISSSTADNYWAYARS